MQRFFLFLTIFLFCACSPSKMAVADEAGFSTRFLDDYVVPAGTEFENTSIGGLSGIDYMGENKYLLISDQKSNPRFYRASILFSEQKIDTVVFTVVILLKEENTEYADHYFDLEAIRQNPETGKIVIASEGNIDAGKNPGIYRLSETGTILSTYTIPEYFEAESDAQPQNNGVFEALSNSFDQAGIWAATELPLKADGPKPMLVKTTSPVRITYFDNASQTAETQFVYLLDSIAKIPLLPFYINGVTDILALKPNKFLVLERQFSAGWGQNGNTIRIYEADISDTTNTLNMPALKDKMDEIIPAKKRLVFDFDSIKDQLSEGFIDNIEGMTFGPTLPNGNKSLLLVSDNNFNSLGPQLNQLILLELTNL